MAKVVHLKRIDRPK